MHKPFLFMSLVFATLIGYQTYYLLDADEDEPTRREREAALSADRAITQGIRANIAADPATSIYARSITITTENGYVVLRGAVINEAEKNDVIRKARLVTGVKTVEEHLEILNSINR